MALKRGKNQIQLPSGNNISINPPQSSLLSPVVDNALGYLESVIDRDNTYNQNKHEAKLNDINARTKEIEYQNTVDQKNLTEIERRKAEDYKAYLKDQKKQKDAANKKLNNINKQGTSKNYALAIIQLQNYSLNKAEEFYNNPKGYTDAMKEYYESNINEIYNYVDTDGLLQSDYQTDYAVKYNEIYNQAFSGIFKQYSESASTSDKQTIIQLQQSAMQHFSESVKYIDSPSSLIAHNSMWMSQIAELEKAHQVYQEGHDKYSQLSKEEYLEDIHMPMLVNHDTELLTHAFTSNNFGIFDGTLESLEDAKIILQVWSDTFISEDGLDSSFDIDKHVEKNFPNLSDERYFKIETFSELLIANTHHEWGFDSEQQILNEVNQQIENKIKEVEKNNILQSTIEYNNHKDWQNNIDWDNLNINIPTENKIKEHSMMLDENKNLVFDVDAYQNMMTKKIEREQLISAGQAIILGDEIEAINALKNTQWKGKISEAKEHAFRMVLGEEFDTIGNFANLAKAIRSGGDMPIPDNVQTVLNLMTQQKYFPHNFTKVLEMYANPNMNIDTDAEMEVLMDLATVYNYVADNVDGLTVWNLDKNHAQALRMTYDAYTESNQSATVGLKAWNNKLSPDKEQVRKNSEIVDNFLLNNYDVFAKFDKEFNEANASTEFFSTSYWFGWASESLGLNEIEMKNLMNDTTTFYKGYWNNMMIKPSAEKEFKRIVRDKMIQSVAGMGNLNEQALQGMMEGVLWQSVLDMSDNNYAISHMAFDPDIKNGPVLMESNLSPEAITGQNKEELSTNALAFLAQVLQTQDADEIANMVGFDVASDEAGTWMNNIYDLVDQGKIKLQYNPSSNDKGNEEFYVWFKNADDIWTTLKQDGVPTSWIPNNRFTLNMGYTRTLLIKEKADQIARENTDAYFSKNSLSRVPVEGSNYADTPEGREAFYENEKWLQENIILPMIDKWESTKDNWASWDDNVANTISEQISNMLTEIDISVKETQNNLNQNFNTGDLVFSFYSQFNEPINLNNPEDVQLLKDELGYTNKDIELVQKTGLQQEEKLKLITNRVEKNFAQVKEIYEDIGVVVHPAHQFVINDIIDVMGNTSKVEKGSVFYNALKQENYSVALKELKLLRPFFKDESRLNALINMWGYPD